MSAGLEPPVTCEFGRFSVDGRRRGLIVDGQLRRQALAASPAWVIVWR